MCSRLQPDVPEAATRDARGCNPMCQRLQPHVSRWWRPSSSPQGRYITVTLPLQVVATKQQSHVLNEKRILASMDHPFILRLIATYQDEGELYMLLEIGSGPPHSLALPCPALRCLALCLVPFALCRVPCALPCAFCLVP